MRFSFASAHLSICLLTFCVSGTRRETGSPPPTHPGNQAATGKDAMFYPAGVRSTKPSQRHTLPSGAKQTCYFQVTMGEKTVHVLEMLIESK